MTANNYLSKIIFLYEFLYILINALLNVGNIIIIEYIHAAQGYYSVQGFINKN